MDKFTVEEINLMCVFEGQDRMDMVADIKKLLQNSKINYIDIILYIYYYRTNKYLLIKI